MGQAMATMFWRLLGRGGAGKSLLCDHNDDEERSLFGRFWQMWRAIIRRLLGRGAGKPPSDPIPYSLNSDPINNNNKDALWYCAVADYDDDQYYSYSSPYHTDQYSIVDIGIDHQTFETAIGEVAVTVAVAEDDVDVDGGGNYETIYKSSSPAELIPILPIRNGRLGPYSWGQKILLVGEGDFSFSASLAVAFADASNMIATSLDSIEFLMKNYKKAMSNILELTNRSCKVMHGVNATKMANHPQLRSLKFDCIVYNFPHAGFGNRHASRDAQISKHQALVRGFLANAKKMIKDDGQIHITHKCVGFFLEWNLELLGTTEGLHLVEESPFNSRHYPGYSTKFGYGGDSNFDCRPSKMYKFQLPNSPKKKRTRRRKRS